VSLVLLLITGFMFWQPWFADFFPIPLRRFAMLVHAASALALVLSVIMHVYAAIWVKGSFRAMTRGTVHEDWAKSHHPLWYKEVAEDAKRNKR
jgi:formate dehydrogenase subunit gamma